MSKKQPRATKPLKLDLDQLDRSWRRLLEIAIHVVARRIYKDTRNAHKTNQRERPADTPEADQSVKSAELPARCQ